MQDWILIVIVGASEFVWSWLADMSILKTVTRKKWQAAAYDIGALALTYSVLTIIAKNDWNLWMISAAIVGASGGTFIVASRKPKRRKRSIKKVPFTTV